MPREHGKYTLCVDCRSLWSVAFLVVEQRLPDCTTHAFSSLRNSWIWAHSRDGAPNEYSGVCMLFWRDFEVGKSWSYDIWLNAGLTTEVRVQRDGSSSCWDIYLNSHRLKMKIHRVVSEIWPWEFSLLQLKREICLRIPEYAGVVWSGVVLLRRKPEIHGRRDKFRGFPCTRVHQSHTTDQFTRAYMLLGGRVTVPRPRKFSDCSSLKTWRRAPEAFSWNACQRCQTHNKADVRAKIGRFVAPWGAAAYSLDR